MSVAYVIVFSCELLLSLLFTPCRKLRLVDVEEFHNREESMELHVFQQLVSKHIESAKDVLLKK